MVFNILIKKQLLLLLCHNYLHTFPVVFWLTVWKVIFINFLLFASIIQKRKKILLPGIILLIFLFF